MIVAGLGFRETASVASLRDALARGAADQSAQALATAAEKCDNAALRALAAETGLRIICVAQHDLVAQKTLTVSENARVAYGTGSVAEAAALAAAGHGSRLLGPRVVSDDRMATCAFAMGDRI